MFKIRGNSISKIGENLVENLVHISNQTQNTNTNNNTWRRLDPQPLLGESSLEGREGRGGGDFLGRRRHTAQ